MTHDTKEPSTNALPRASRRMPDRPCVLLAEDDEAMRALLALALRTGGYAVEALVDGTHLVARLAAHEPAAFDAVVSDVRMPGVSGLQVLEGLQACPAAPPVILITAFGDRETHETAHRLGAAAILDKPFDISLLLAELARIAPVARGSAARPKWEDSQ